MRRLLARCTSRNVRCRPPSLQKGCSALTMPAPCVQRLPAPAASVTTATSPGLPARPGPASRYSFGRLARGVEHVAVGHVLNLRADRQAVLGQADAAAFEIGADLLVLRAVEAVAFEQRGQRGRRRRRRSSSAAAAGRTASAPCRAIRAWCGRRRRICPVPRGATAATAQASCRSNCGMMSA